MTSALLKTLSVALACLLAISPLPQTAKDQPKYTSAQEAFGVGAAFYNSRNFPACRAPFEAALRMAKDDEDMKLRIYAALLQPYRLIPEFEPYQTAAEYLISHHPQDANRSLTRRSYLSFSYQRGQMQKLVKRYEKRLKKDPNDWMSLYLLSEIYSGHSGLPESVETSTRAIELTNRLAKLDAEKRKQSGQDPGEMSAAEAAKISRQKAKLAGQYVRAKDYKKAAQLYEEIAALDPTTHAWNLKEAAVAWLKLDNRQEALRLTAAAEKAPAEARNDQLTHFFERGMGDLFMELKQPQKAIPHYRIAVEKTQIEGYVKATEASLAEALEQAGE